MNLISCSGCGTVLDLSKIGTPEIYNEDGTINTTIATWSDREYVPTILCPVCNCRIAIVDIG